MTIVAERLQSLAEDLVKAAEAYEKVEAERDEYRRRLKMACEVIERNSLQMDFAEATQLRSTGT